MTATERHWNDTRRVEALRGRGGSLRRAAIAAWVAMLLLAASGPLRAAADWEWTRGEGWTMGAGSARGTAEAQLEHAYELEQKGEFYDAARQYFLLVRIYPDTPEAGLGLQRLALCLFKMENYYQSFLAIEQVMESYPESARPADLLEIQYRIGRRLMAGAEVSLLDQAEGEDARTASLRAAVEVFESVLRHDPYGPLAAETLLALGDTARQLGEIRKARGFYERILAEHRSREEILKKANIGLVQCDVAEGKAGSQQVETMIARLRAEAAQSGRADEFDENLRQLEEAEARKMWENAQVWANMGTHRHVKSYKWQLKEIARRYPHTTYARRARETLSGVEVPPAEGSLFDRFSIVPKLWRTEEPPAFVTPQENEIMVEAHRLPTAIPGVPGGSDEGPPTTAGAEPAAPSPAGERYTMAPAGSTAPRTGSGARSAPPSPSRADASLPAGTGSAAGLSPGGAGSGPVRPGAWQLEIPDAGAESVERTRSEPSAPPAPDIPELPEAPAPAPRRDLTPVMQPRGVPGVPGTAGGARGDTSPSGGGGVSAVPATARGSVPVPARLEPEGGGVPAARPAPREAPREERGLDEPVRPPSADPAPSGGWEFSEELQ